MSTDREERFWKNALTDAPSPKKTGRETLSPRSFLSGGVRLYRWPMFSLDTMWKVGQIREKTSLTNKSVYVRKGSNICAFIVCFEQHKLPQLNCFFSAGSFTAKISINTFNVELFSLEVYCLCCVLWLIPDSNGASFHYLCYLQIK